MNYSRQKEIIKNIFINNKGKHFTLNELYLEALEVLPTIGRATIYRNVKSLSEEGFLREIGIDKSTVLYDLVKQPHDHIICKKCGKVVDTQIIIKKEQIPNGFTLTDKHVIIHALCSSCDNTR